MGLFNSGKSEKVDKVDKYEEHHEVQSSKARPNRSSKHHRANKFGAIIRPMPQPLPLNGNYFQGSIGYSGNPYANVSQYKFPFPSSIPYDLSKLSAPSYPYPPYSLGQTTPISLPPIWGNSMYQFNDRSPFQQNAAPFANYQANPWAFMPPTNYPYVPPMNF